MVPALLPAYNVGPLLPAVLRACAVLPELLVVDDGSTDSTPAVLASVHVPTITHPQNRGKGSALRTGFEALLQRPEVTGVLTLDGDGQHDPADATQFFAAHTAEPDALILGNRWHSGQRAPALRAFANSLSTGLVRLLSRQAIRDSQCGYRLYPRALLERALPLLPTTGHFETETELLFLAARMRIPMRTIPIRTVYTAETQKHSSWRAVRDSVRISRVLLRAIGARPIPPA